MGAPDVVSRSQYGRCPCGPSIFPLVVLFRWSLSSRCVQCLARIPIALQNFWCTCQARHPRAQCCPIHGFGAGTVEIGSSGSASASRAPRQLAVKNYGNYLSRRRRVSVGVVTWTPTSLLDTVAKTVLSTRLAFNLDVRWLHRSVAGA